MISFEERWPGTFTVQDYAEPLVQQLSRYADHSDAAGERERAEALREEADRLTERHLDLFATASVARTRAMEHAAAGRFHEALAGLSAAHQAFESSGDRVQAAQTLIQQGNVLEWLCDYDRSLAVLDTAESLVAEDLGDGPPSGARIALAFGKEVLNIVRGKHGTGGMGGMEALALRRVHVEILQGRARVNRRLGNYDEARRLFDESRSFVELLVGPGIDFHVAAIALAQGELEEADRLLSTIAPAFEKRGLLRPRRAAVRQLQADLLLAQDRPAEALARADDGLADQERYPDLDLAWKLQWRRARALSALGRAQESLDAYEAAADAADTLRLAPLGYVLDTKFLQDKLPMFEQAIDEAVGQHDAVRAVHFMELVKARALAAVLGNPRLPGDIGNGLEARFDAVCVELDALSFKLDNGSAAAADLTRRQQLLRTRTELLEEIRVQDPRWRAVTVPARVGVQSHAGRSVLVLHRRGRRIVSVAIGPDRTVMGELTCTEETDAALLEYAANLRKSSPDWFLSDLSGELGVTLTDLVPDAVAAAAVAAETLVVVPHGILHLLPWAALHLGERRLFEHTAVGVLPNLSALTLLDGDLGRPRSVALLGDPDYADLHTYQDLPQAGAEIEDVAGLYDGDLVAPPVTRAAADQGALVALLQEPDVAGSVLHVVSHGDLDADDPLSSGLVLTGSRLDAAEVMQLRCAYPEVVLSACSTGWRPQASRGLELAGDDALGLTASFLEAGARSLLASIPQAKDDVTRRFMVEWHRQRRAGATPLHATRHVQLELFAADPAAIWSWAGITAYGCR
ncbi:CHAT domain-containing protein [Cellulomonas sp. 179-A 9B4 NHS]|uniref:CHAT domain-containing protein n=1 Tax=Cellulomonas sp. 179-A 9B4 NHS TaxID=3142379 RepID=UPI00399F2375